LANMSGSDRSFCIERALGWRAALAAAKSNGCWAQRVANGLSQGFGSWSHRRSGVLSP
jgi:hypothetical protein